MSATGGSARAVWSALLDGSIRSPGAWGLTLTTMAPLLLVAVGAIVATRAGLINIGQEGQLLIGACFAAYVAVRLPGPGPLVIVAALLAAAVGGGLWAGIAAAAQGVAQRARGAHHAAADVHRLSVADVRPAQRLAARRSRRTAPATSTPASRSPFDTRLPNLDVFGNRIDSAVVLALGVPR